MLELAEPHVTDALVISHTNGCLMCVFVHTHTWRRGESAHTLCMDMSCIGFLLLAPGVHKANTRKRLVHFIHFSTQALI